MFPVEDVLLHQFNGQNTSPTSAGVNTVPVTTAATPSPSMPPAKQFPGSVEERGELGFHTVLTMKFFDEF